MKLFKNFLKIWATTTMCAFVPFFTFSFAMGFLGNTISAVFITLIFKEELS